MAVGIAIMALFSVAAIVVGALAIADLGSARSEVVATLDPASYEASQLEVALLNQETGIRGYALSGQQVFLRPYTLGVAGQKTALARLDTVLAGLPGARADLRDVLASVSDWRAGYAIPVMREVAATGKAPASPTPQRRQGRLRQHPGRPDRPAQRRLGPAAAPRSPRWPTRPTP